MNGLRERFIMASRREETDSAMHQVLGALERLGYDKPAIFAIRLAIEEAMTNALRHGNREDPALRITMTCDIGPSEAVIDIEDEGEGYDPASVPDPTANENLDIPSGRGLMLMRSFMAEVKIHPPGNRVTLRYRLH